MSFKQKKTNIAKNFGGGFSVTPVIAVIVIATILAFSSVVFADSDRGFKVYIHSDNCVQEVTVDNETVGDILKSRNIVLGMDDEVIPSLDTVITEDTVIKVHRVNYVEYNTTELIPYTTIRTESPHHKLGDEIIETEGVVGTSRKFIRDKYVNGLKVSSRVISEEKTEAVDEKILIGTAKNVPISKREGDYRLVNGIPETYEYKLSGKATAYTAREGCGTYSGRPLIVGSVAVDPEIIPFGSELYIVSQDGSHVYGYAIASDTGDLTQAGVLVDVFMGITDYHYGDACRWGAQYCDVYVIREGDNSVSWR